MFKILFLVISYSEIILHNFMNNFKKNKIKNLKTCTENKKRIDYVKSYDDIEQILKIYRNNFKDSLDSELKNYLLKTPDLTYILYVDNKIIGYATFRLSTKLWLYSTSIVQEYQNKGLGKELLIYALEDVLKKTKKKNVFLIVNSNNNARFLYNKLLFNEIIFFSSGKKRIMKKTII
ncbi:MAG: GNAT family N-acetyltransferase [Alphaproteobacteria bacterium]|nr:GNAT family N-acetyltransferase [Alphaproteobacteria bacterium]